MSASLQLQRCLRAWPARLRAWPALLTALFSSGCFIVGENHGVPDGSLVVDWTVKGTKDPRACAENGAVTFDVIVETADGVSITEQQSDCESFELSVPLPPDAYRIDAVMLDAHGHRTTTAVRDTVRVRSAQSDVSAVDFPADSFL